MKEFVIDFYKSIIAGCCIGIGAIIYLKIGGVVGACLFSVGLLAVVTYGLNLYTGKAGFLEYKDSWKLLFILIGNIIGCWIMSMLPIDGIDATNIVTLRLANGWDNAFLMSIPCGFLMTTSVYFAKKGLFLPLLFSVPAFIICGFYHCVADAFYYCLNLTEYSVDFLLIYCATVIGNYIGCNLHKLFLEKCDY